MQVAEPFRGRPPDRPAVAGRQRENWTESGVSDLHGSALSSLPVPSTPPEGHRGARDHSAAAARSMRTCRSPATRLSSVTAASR